MKDIKDVSASGRLRAEQANAGSSSEYAGSETGAPSLPLAVGGRAVVDGDRMIFLGRTGDGRYAFVDAEDFGCCDRAAASRIVMRGRIGTEILLGHARPVKRITVDRRGRWTNSR